MNGTNLLLLALCLVVFGFAAAVTLIFGEWLLHLLGIRRKRS